MAPFGFRPVPSLLIQTYRKIPTYLHFRPGNINISSIFTTKMHAGVGMERMVEIQNATVHIKTKPVNRGFGERKVVTK